MGVFDLYWSSLRRFLPLRTTLAEAPIVRGSIGYAPGRGKSAGRNGWTVKE